ncbi:MAG: phenylacetate--CoA ligase family protein [Nitrososphaeria archaeon]
MVNYLRAYYYLRSAIKRAYWPRKKLVEFQNKRLREIIRYAYENVPFYHEKYRQAGLRPDDVRTVDDLSKLPIIRRDEVKRNLNRMISTEYDVKELRMLRTSGSTGEPLYFYISGREDELRKAKHLRANIACGQKPWHRWVVITSPIYFNQAGRLQKLLGIYAPISVSVFDDVSKQISIIERLKPDVLDGYASSLLLLTREVEKRGITTIKPKIMISGADLIDKASREYVEKVFGVPFYDQYGAAEFERLAWQCEEKSQYHIDADSVVMQFIDENEEEVAPGERGEIVCTSLINRAMPFIRYALGDVGKASEQNECPCGRNLPLMDVIEGRRDDVIVLPDGRLISAFAFIAAMYQLSFYQKIEKFRVIQRSIDYFDILIKLNNAEKVDINCLVKELTGHFRGVFNLDDKVNFNVEFVDDISLDSSGKFRIVVSKV